MSFNEQFRQEHAAREAAQNQNQPMMIQDGSETGAPTAPAAIVNPVQNPFAPFAGVPGLGGTATTEAIHNVMNSIRFQQSNVILPTPDSSQTAIGDIAASVANLSQSVTLFGAAQQAANAELRQFGHDTLESTHQTLNRVVEINAQSAQTTAKHLQDLTDAHASALRNATGPIGVPAVAAGGSDPVLIAILEKMTDAVQANQTKQATVATTLENVLALDAALTMMQTRAHGSALEAVQSAHHGVDQFSRLTGVESDKGLTHPGLSDVRKQWTHPDMVHLQYLLTRCQHIELHSQFDRNQARLAFGPFFMEKNHCKQWFEQKKNKDWKNKDRRDRTDTGDRTTGDRNPRAAHARKQAQRIKELETKLERVGKSTKPGADKGVGSG
jgi:hypothetical protein